ncbi:MAG: NAD(P)/FAD-dependent oxidoreductase [Ferrimicrobium sp.]
MTRGGGSVIHDSLRGAKDEVFWLDDPAAPPPKAPLSGSRNADCVVVGGGFCGLWSALLIKERKPEWNVVLVEGGRIGWGASGRNGGFCDASLTHGLENGLARFPGEMAIIERLGVENLDAIAGTISKEEIDCGYEPVGTIDVATAPWQLEGLAELAELAPRYGYDVTLLDQEETRRLVHSPTYEGGLVTRNRCALVNPARLAWGLAALAERQGIEIFEGTTIQDVSDRGLVVELTTTGSASLQAPHVVLATNAYRPLLPGVQPFILPVYDYVLMSEPLDTEQLSSIGWSGRQGLSDAGNLFHYYRLSADNRILFGGYDAIYHYGNAMSARYRQRPATFGLLAQHFFATFPQLAGLGFSHAWGGAIDTSSRFSMFFGKRYRGKVHYAAGFTGLGVAATRFAGIVLRDRVVGDRTQASELSFVRRKPIPFPPEPLRSGVVELTRRSLMAADRNGGNRNAWLKLLDRMGVGFDS